MDVVNEKIFSGTVVFSQGRITRLVREENDSGNFIVPGLIDAHVHIESSMLIPSEFARMAVNHGTVATVSDPHEIANVLGPEGIRFMIDNGRKVPFIFNFGAPSCVPATGFESSGATIGPEEIGELLSRDDIKYLSEMMNFPGVIHKDPVVMAKIGLAKQFGKPVDGHAPGLTGEDAKKYAMAGITTDHECFTIGEAEEKLRYGMKILIREGSAARNFDTLIPLLKDYPDNVMFCSDDKHPDDLQEGHINLLVRRAVKQGYDAIKVLRACTLNPVRHYGLDVGLLQEGDPADFIVVDNLSDFKILGTYIQGTAVSENGRSLIEPVNEKAPNVFHAERINEEDIRISDQGKKIRVQMALDGQLITDQSVVDPKTENGFIVSDPGRDVLKMIVMNRYEKAAPVVSFAGNFGLKRGAIASTVAHDSHNIIAVGASDREIVNAVNHLIDSKGGIVAVDGNDHRLLQLPVAGIMTNRDARETAAIYTQVDKAAKDLGSTLKAPFMTLSFMALLVIPRLKTSDRGIFDGEAFRFTSLFV